MSPHSVHIPSGIWKTAAAAGLALFFLGARFGLANAGAFDAIIGPGLDAPPSAATEPLKTPIEYTSSNGKLQVTMEARATRTQLGPYQVNGATYNGVYGGPVLRLKPGDVLEMTLVNHLAQATNVHFHGLQVSPLGHGDDSMHMVLPGETWNYSITIPKTHPPGVYWFHTHGHGFAERQLMGGLSGTIIIEGFQDQISATKPLVERLLVLKEFSAVSNGAQK